MEDRATVLLADQSESFLMYLSILLQRMDYEVLPTPDGSSLLKLNKTIQPALIILGPDVPGLSSREILKALKQETENNVPVIVIGEDRSNEEDLRALGCGDFLTKPIDVDLLHATLVKLRPNPDCQRQHLRVNFHNIVTLTMNDQIIKCQGVTLSAGGIFIRRKIPFPQGSRLQIEIPVGENEYLFLDGEVIYTKQVVENRLNIPPGMAIQFLNMIEEDRLALNKFIKQLLISDLIDEQDEPIIKE